MVAPLRSVILTASDEPAGSKFFAANMEKTASAYVAINRFLSTFIDHGLKDLDYAIRDKTLVQRILDIEQLDDCNESKYSRTLTPFKRCSKSTLCLYCSDCGVFYSDAGQSFDNVHLYGNELELFQLELMIFALVVCLFGNGLLALFVVAGFQMVSGELLLIKHMNIRANPSHPTVCSRHRCASDETQHVPKDAHRSAIFAVNKQLP